MQQVNEAGSQADIDLGVNDLGPLAWVLDELRKSLDGASKALKRFVRDAEIARGSDLAAIDSSQLRIARQQLHQSVGALEMVGLQPPATVLRAMEAAVQKFLARPELCNEAAAAKVERTSFALTEYLEGVLGGKTISSVALFPQYREVQELAGSDRIHPADLWPLEWRWNDIEAPTVAAPLHHDAATRARFDQHVLKVIKTGDPAAARELAGISLALSAGQEARQPRIFWKICAAYFEGLAAKLIPVDVYSKRAASRILLQFTTLAKGDLGVSDRLALDLLFFCAQGVPVSAAEAPTLTSVRKAYGLARFRPVNYEESQFGRFDPALLAQARKRISTAKETWSTLSGGDANKLKNVADQFSLLTDSLVKLHPDSAPLAQALTRTIESIVKGGQAPAPELAMEVATSVLYLEAAFEDLDPNDPDLARRTNRLAERLDTLRAGGQQEPTEAWMEDVYRRVADRQNMGSVVGELRTSLGDLEKSLDQFFRNPQDKTVLRDVPGQLSQMRGVLSVLGLDQASHAVLKMRDAIEQIMVTEIDEEKARAAGTFDKLGNNLGALGFLIDMLNYQPALAKKLFVYDDALGELKPLMGRSAAQAEEEAPAVDALAQEVSEVVAGADASRGEDLSVRLDSLAAHAVLADQPQLARSAREASAAVSAHDADAAAKALTQLAQTAAPAPAPAPVAAPAAEDDFEEDDLRDIFLEEANEVVQNGLAALQALKDEPGSVSEQTTLRRAFHTLKGSSRMVGLTEFGEAGWSMEQVMNAWLADQKPASEDLLALCNSAMNAFALWTQDIAANNDGHWKASLFRTSADALRTQGQYVPLELPGAAAAPAAAEAPVVPDSATIRIDDFDVSTMKTQAFQAEVPPVAAAPVQTPEISLPDFDFDLPAPAAEAPVPAAPAFEVPEIGAIDFDSLSAVSGAAPAATEPEPFAEASAAAPTPAIELPADLPADFPADFDLEIVPEAAQAASPVAEPAAAGPIAEAVEVAEITDFEIDFPAPAPEAAAAEVVEVAEVAEVTEVTEAVEAAPEPEPMFEAPESVDAVDAVDTEPHGEAQAEEDSGLAGLDEQVKVIGTLRIGIPLYNVYLNEADEWSRRLVNELGEWALEKEEPVPDSAVALAHSLAGSSATVGFHALSEMARALEHALQHAQAHPRGARLGADTFTAAAEDIRRLLHQFAAGFLKEPDGAVIEQLRNLQEADLPESAFPPGAADGFDFAEPFTEPAAAAAPPSVTIIHPPEAAAPPAEAPMHAQVAPAAAVVPVFAGEDEDDEIDAVDVIDPDLFPIFEEEAVELMPALGTALRQWGARPDNRGARDQVLRHLHTLKGSARLAGALRLGEMSHRLETEIEHLGAENIQGTQIEPLLARFDALQGNFDKLREADHTAQAQEAEAQHQPAAAEEEARAAGPTGAQGAAAPAPAPMAPLAS
ncbi:MAG: Hpt domain-containing protein, partial [Burkholderiaceae bacterium]